MANWIKRSNKLPEKCQVVLGYFTNGSMYVVSQCDREEICDDWHTFPKLENSECNLDYKKLIYWMPLPEPPRRMNDDN